MASEIEIVAEGGTPRGQNGEVSSSGVNPEAEGQNKREDVYTAAAYGDVDKLRWLVEERGCSVLEPDSGGYFALQWCALNNRTAAAQYLIEVIYIFCFFCFCFRKHFLSAVENLILRNVLMLQTILLFIYTC